MSYAIIGFGNIDRALAKALKRPIAFVGVATGKIKATNKPFKDDWEMDASGLA